jgi:1-deoxy-D-xylulose-5-phosphate synthase
LEENSSLGGLGAAVLEWMTTTSQHGDPQVINIGLPDRFLEHATRTELLAMTGLQGEQICARVLKEMDQLGRKRRAQSAS